METGLQYITEVLDKLSAFEFAESRLNQEKEHTTITMLNTESGIVSSNKVSYEDYMKGTWSNKESATLEECIEESRMSALDEYAEMVDLHTGFIRNGRVFVLDKTDKIVFFLYDQHEDKGQKWASLYTHYNPKNIDCIETMVNSKYLFEDMEKDKYEISQDEGWIIKECHKLI